MVSMKFTVLLAVATVVAFASSAVVTPVQDANLSDKSSDDDSVELNSTPFPDLTDDEDEGDDDYDDNATIDGIPINRLSEEELNDLLDEDDNMVASDLDITVARKIVDIRKDDAVSQANDIINGGTQGGRQRRWVGIAARLFSAGRALFKGSARAPKPTVSGNRVTQQYTRPGSYGDAVRDFNRFRPDNVKSFGGKNGISGQTGTVGNHRVTVRDGSKQGSPTLEIRSPRPNGEHVRKFRYNQK